MIVLSNSKFSVKKFRTSPRVTGFNPAAIMAGKRPKNNRARAGLAPEAIHYRYLFLEAGGCNAAGSASSLSLRIVPHE
jgi:hypothetical protein